MSADYRVLQIQVKNSETMNNSISSMPLGNLTLAVIPALAGAVLLYACAHNYRMSLYAITRTLARPETHPTPLSAA